MHVHVPLKWTDLCYKSKCVLETVKELHFIL